jgi:trigger factor
MQVTVENTSALGRKMTVEVPAERIEPEVEKRLKSMTRDVKLHGFRPGKVPFRIVKQRFGDKVQREVLGEVLQSSYQQAVTQENLRPTGGPSIVPSVVESGKGLTYTATFEVFPEIELADIDGLEITRPVAEVTEADIDKTLDSLRKQRRTWNEVSRAAQPGDQLTIDFEGKIDGDAFEGGKAENFTLELGSGRMLKAFEDGLIGARDGEDVIIEMTFPEDYRPEDLAGKAATFAVKVKSISEPALPEVDDELARSYGVQSGGIPQFRDEIRSNMERELKQMIKSRLKEQVMDGLLERNQVELPESLVKEEVSRARKQMMENLGMNDHSKFPDVIFEENARKRVANWLLISETIKAHEIKLEEQRVEQMLQSIAASYEDPQQLINHYRSDRNAMSQIESMAMEEQIVEWVMDKAIVKDEDMSYDQVLNKGTTEIK